jgi:hypothetical protein
MADPGFDIPFSSTVDVSGGGTALATAVSGAGPNTRLRIMDSLEYDPVVVSGKTNLSIVAAAGETPVIRRPAPATFPSTASGWALRISSVVTGLKLQGLTFVDHGNRNSFSFPDNGLVSSREDCTGLTNVIIEDCAFQEASDSPLNGLNGILLASGAAGAPDFDKVVVRRCTFDTLGAGPNNTGENLGAISIFGFGDVWIQNCWIYRDDGLVSRANSHQRGVVVRNENTLVENVLCDDLGTAGSNESFKTINSSGSQYGSAVGPSTFRNCVAYQAKRGFRGEQPSSTMAVLSSVVHVETSGITDRAFRRTASADLLVRNSVAVGAGDGTAFESAAIMEDHNDIFNYAALGKTLDLTDLQRDPLFDDPPGHIWEATDAFVAAGASDAGPMGVRYSGTGEAIIWI